MAKKKKCVQKKDPFDDMPVFAIGKKKKPAAKKLTRLEKDLTKGLGDFAAALKKGVPLPAKYKRSSSMPVSAVIRSEAEDIARERALAAINITAIIAAIQAIAALIEGCQSRGETWSAIKARGRERVGLALAHRRVVKQLGAVKANRLGGKDFTQYLIDRYKTRKASELKSLVAAATA